MVYEIMLDLARIVRDNFGGRITNATEVYTLDHGLFGHLFIVPESGINDQDGMAGILDWHADHDGTNAEITASFTGCYKYLGEKVSKWAEIVRTEVQLSDHLFEAIYDELDHGRRE